MDDSLVFVDVARGGRLGDVRWLPRDKFRRVSRVLVRGDGVTRKEIDDLIGALQWNATSGLLVQKAGEDARIESSQTWPDGENILRRARAVELAGLLVWGEAVWRPRDYHYALPSGRHIGSFVKLGDAFHEPRDAEVLASWLAPDLQDNVGIVIDSGTLTPMAVAAQSWMLRAELTPGPVVVLENYPRTELDARAAVRAANFDGSVLAILSVSSSGRLRDRIVRGLEGQPAVTNWKVHVLVDATPPTTEVAEVETWLPNDRLESPAVRSIEPPLCSHCSDPATRPVVAIHSRSFQGLVPSQVHRLMPDVTAALAAREFWELCDAATAIGVEELPAVAVRRFRGRALPMAVRVRIERLLDQELFADAVRSALDLSAPAPDIVLVPQSESDLEGYDAFWNRLRGAGASEYTPFPLDTQWDEGLRAQVAQASSILVFAIGAVTGASLQTALVAVQSIRRDAQLPEYKLAARVVNARPARRREWETLVNSYSSDGGNLEAAWLTYLPERSPMVDERRVLSNLVFEGSEEAVTFLERRKRFCAGELDVDDEPLFWGGRMTDRLTPHSVFGEGMAAATVYAAVASALETRRLREPRAHLPELRQFEMRAIVRSYYDPLILAAILRWLEPNEADWGAEWGYGGDAVVGELLARAAQVEPDHLRTLIPELLLATALGKLDGSGAEFVLANARSFLEKETDAETNATVEVGLAAAARGPLGIDQPR